MRVEVLLYTEMPTHLIMQSNVQTNIWDGM